MKGGIRDQLWRYMCVFTSNKNSRLIFFKRYSVKSALTLLEVEIKCYIGGVYTERKFRWVVEYPVRIRGDQIIVNFVGVLNEGPPSLLELTFFSFWICFQLPTNSCTYCVYIYFFISKNICVSFTHNKLQEECCHIKLLKCITEVVKPCVIIVYGLGNPLTLTSYLYYSVECSAIDIMFFIPRFRKLKVCLFLNTHV